MLDGLLKVYCIYFGNGDNSSIVQIPVDADYNSELESYKKKYGRNVTIDGFLDFLNEKYPTKSSRLNYKTVNF